MQRGPRTKSVLPIRAANRHQAAWIGLMLCVLATTAFANGIDKAPYHQSPNSHCAMGFSPWQQEEDEKAKPPTPDTPWRLDTANPDLGHSSAPWFHEPEPAEATLLLVGDLMQHSPQFKRAQQPDGSFDYSPCFEEVAPYIAAADLAIGNLEVTLGGPPYTGYPCFSAPDDWLRAIKETGFDIVTTSNNHCLDRGRHGLERTLMMTDSLGMLALGTYRDADDREARYPLIVETNGIRFAFLTATYDMNGFTVTPPNIVNTIDTLTLAEDLRHVGEQHPDVIITLMHWGTEYRLTPDSYQQFYARWLFDHGVDHIIGGHPHVIEPTEYIPRPDRPDSHLLVWSQGNFISNMSAPHTTDGTMITLTFRKTGQVTRLAEVLTQTVHTTRPDYRLVITDTQRQSISSR